MIVYVKVFPIADICNQSQKLELLLKEGSFSELFNHLQERLGVDLNPDKPGKLMFLHNGSNLESRKEVVFKDGDQLWMLPMLSGG